MFSKETYIRRREILKHEVREGIIVLLGNGDMPCNYFSNTYAFRQDSSFLYYFAHNLQDLAGVIDCDENKEYLFGNDVDMADIIWTGPVDTIQQRASQIGVQHSGSLDDFHQLIQKAIAGRRSIHFLPPYRLAQRHWLSHLIHVKPPYINELSSEKLIKAVVKQRSVKSEEEIAEIEKAIATAHAMHTTMMRMAARVGTYEYEIAGKMEGIALSGGGPVSFPIILTTHGEILHGHDHSRPLQKGRMVVSDAGCETPMNYCSDITRSVPVGGKFDQRQADIYQIVLNANLGVMPLIKPGVTYAEVHRMAYKFIASGLKELNVIKGNTDDAVDAGAIGLFMPHGLGHMMGLDVHDMESLGEDHVGYDDTHKRSSMFGFSSLRLGKELQKGYVLTDEPGIYFIPALIDRWKAEKHCADFINYSELEKYRDFGGIRLEDDLLVDEHGCQVLGKPIPKTISEIESIMGE